MSEAPAWRRIPVPTQDHIVKGGPTFQDLAGRYLCSVGMSLLNTRHLRGGPRLDPADPQHLGALAQELEKVALEVFDAHWSDSAPGAAHIQKKLRLDQAALLDGLGAKAEWVIARWTPDKIEGRRRGGRHGAKDGVRKGPQPRYYAFQVEEFEHLPPAERREAAMKALGCSASTYYALRRRYLARLAEDGELRDQFDYLLP